MIEVAELRKSFRVHRRSPGLGAALRSLVRRRYETVRAVDGVSFRVERGERVGFLGPNGAGKTTTLKVLSGLLHPSGGTVRVDGFEPRRREPGFLAGITLLMGQKQRLLWDLPPADTFELNRALFDVPRARYRATLDELDALLGLAPLMTKPTRQLSLGERMKCELACALLHRPTTLFLDEPTIGLDVSMQVAVRGFVQAYNQRHGATVLLTSHYMEDVVALCPRVVVIDKGTLLYDGDLRALGRKLHPDKLVSFRLADGAAPLELDRLGTRVATDDGRVVLKVAQDRVREVVGHLLGAAVVSDLGISDPPLEDVMRQLFRPAAAPAERASASAP